MSHLEQTSARRFVSDKELAAMGLGSRPWLQRARWDGSGPPYIKLKGKVLYDLAEVESWFNARKVSSTTQASQR